MSTPTAEKFSSRICALAFCLWGATVSADPLHLPAALPIGGRVVQKKERQALNAHCKAERVWIEVEGSPNAEVEKSINTQIRKKITVGRKLKESDCAPEEDYTFSNSVEVSGVWKRFLGLQTTVCFPGGTGRCVESCDVYDLQTGKRSDLKRYVNSSAHARLEKQLNDQARREGFPSGYLPIKLDEASMCLSNNGISIRFSNDSGSFVAETVVSASQVPADFHLPTELSSDVPTSH